MGKVNMVQRVSTYHNVLLKFYILLSKMIPIFFRRHIGKKKKKKKKKKSFRIQICTISP